MTPTILWPLDGAHPITFLFGEAPKWYTDVFGYPHNGVDIACPIGTPLVSCDEGQVIWADSVPDKDGEGIILAHSWGQSLYWHLSVLIATIGQQVEKGDLIGQTGMTGFATGPHLHFGIKVVGEAPTGMRGWCDPRLYLTTPPVEPPAPEPIGRNYLVLPGDSLWKIAQKFYKNGAEWRRIYDANRDKIKDPNLIRAWQVLRIP